MRFFFFSYFIIYLDFLHAQNLYLQSASYEYIPNAKGCSRLLNSKGTIGCQSSKSYVSGILYQIFNEADYNDFMSIKNGDKFTLVLSFGLFNS